MKLTTAQLEASRQSEKCDNCPKMISFENKYFLLEVVGERKVIGNLKNRERDIKIFCSKECVREWSEKNE